MITSVSPTMEEKNHFNFNTNNDNDKNNDI